MRRGTITPRTSLNISKSTDDKDDKDDKDDDAAAAADGNPRSSNGASNDGKPAGSDRASLRRRSTMRAGMMAISTIAKLRGRRTSERHGAKTQRLPGTQENGSAAIDEQDAMHGSGEASRTGSQVFRMASATLEESLQTKTRKLSPQSPSRRMPDTQIDGSAVDGQQAMAPSPEPSRTGSQVFRMASATLEESVQTKTRRLPSAAEVSEPSTPIT